MEMKTTFFNAQGNHAPAAPCGWWEFGIGYSQAAKTPLFPSGVPREIAIYPSNDFKGHVLIAYSSGSHDNITSRRGKEFFIRVRIVGPALRYF